MLVYGIIMNKEEYERFLLLPIANYQSLFKNKIEHFPYKENHFVGFSLNKMLINPQVEFHDLSCLINKYMNKSCAMHDLK